MNVYIKFMKFNVKFYKKYIKFHKFSFKSFIIFNFIHNLHVKEARCYISNNIFQL